MFVFALAGHCTIRLCPRRIKGLLCSWVQETQLPAGAFPVSVPLLLSILTLDCALSKSLVPFPTLGWLVWAYYSGEERILYCGTEPATCA